MPSDLDSVHIADQMTPGVKLSVTGDLQVNEWNGNKKPQLLIGDIRSDEWQLFDLRGVREAARWLPYNSAQSDTFFIAFHQQTVTHFQSSMKGIPITLLGQETIEKAENLVLLDIPDDAIQLEELIVSVHPDRNLCAFPRT